MKQKIKHILVNAVSSVLLAAPMTVLAQNGLQPAPVFTGTAQNDLFTSVRNLINYGLIIAGLVAAAFIVYGGVRYIISRGDEDAAEEAKATILYAVIGLIVIGLAAALVNFIVRGIQGS